MRKNTGGTITFLVKLMFCRLDIFVGPMFFLFFGGGHIYRGAYIWDVNWVTYLGGAYSGGALYTGGILTVFYGILRKRYFELELSKSL